MKIMLRPSPHIRYHIAAILAVYWVQFVAQYKRWIRPVVFENVRKVLACRSPVLGCHIYKCDSTFGADMKWHPHIHLIVTGGGLSLDEKRWIQTDPRFLMHHGGLKKRWKYQDHESSYLYRASYSTHPR